MEHGMTFFDVYESIKLSYPMLSSLAFLSVLYCRLFTHSCTGAHARPVALYIPLYTALVPGHSPLDNSNQVFEGLNEREASG